MQAATEKTAYVDGRKIPARAIPRFGLVRPAVWSIPKIVRWSFIAFAATLPFEAADLKFTSEWFSLAKVSGLAFLAVYFFYYNPVSGKRAFPALSVPLQCFLGYLAVYLVNGIFLDRLYLGQFLSIFITLVQLLVLFWVAAGLLRNEVLARNVLLAFALASVVLALGNLLNLPGFSTAIETHLGERMTSLQFNPNFLAYSMALAAVTLVGLQMNVSNRSLVSRLFLMALILPLLAMIVRTGSRAGLAAFAIGFLAYLLPQQSSERKFVTVMLVVFITGALTYMIIEQPTVLIRMQEVYGAKLVDRELITRAGFHMFTEKPLFGWQPVYMWEELGRRLGHVWGVKDAHNLFLHLLLEVGIVGAAPFLIGFGLCVRSAWRARWGSFGLLPLALIFTTLVANVSHTYLTRKPLWLVLALSLGAGHAALMKKQGIPLRRRRVGRNP